jgi:Cu(I)/Ag(I) efflux system membrane protein CusA/SilA
VLERLIDASIRNRFLVGLAVLFVAAWGTYALLDTPLDAIPDLSDTQVIIATDYPREARPIAEDQVS